MIEELQADIAFKKSLWVKSRDEIARVKAEGEENTEAGEEAIKVKEETRRLAREFAWRKGDWTEAARYWSKTLGPILRGRLEFVGGCDGY